LLSQFRFESMGPQVATLIAQRDPGSMKRA
jgi:hypothetical protein